MVSLTNSVQVAPWMCANPSAFPRMDRRLWTIIMGLTGGKKAGKNGAVVC